MPWQAQDARFLAVVRLFRRKPPCANALFRIYRLWRPEPVFCTRGAYRFHPVNYAPKMQTRFSIYPLHKALAAAF